MSLLEPTRRSGPRVLIVAGLLIHLPLAFLFWMVSAGFVLGVARLYPLFVLVGVLSAIFVGGWCTRAAWRRNTWLAAVAYLLVCIVSLPWTILALIGWFHPN